MTLSEIQEEQRRKNTEKMRRYRAANPEKIREINRRCREKNPEKKAESDRQQYIKNREKKLAYQRAWDQANRERSREARFKRNFGITIADYDRMYAEQDGKCAICESSETGREGYRFHVDHDHATKAVRGLLCHHCNTGIGSLGDSVERLRKAIAYLEKSRISATTT